MEIHDPPARSRQVRFFKRYRRAKKLSKTFWNFIEHFNGTVCSIERRISEVLHFCDNVYDAFRLLQKPSPFKLHSRIFLYTLYSFNHFFFSNVDEKPILLNNTRGILYIFIFIFGVNDSFIKKGLWIWRISVIEFQRVYSHED